MRRFYLIAILIFTACSSAQYRGPDEVESCQAAKRVSAPVLQTDPAKFIRAADVQRLVGHYNTCISELDKDAQASNASHDNDFWSTVGKIATAFGLGAIAGASIGH